MIIPYKKTGVWMDYSNAHIISFAETSPMPKTITSGFTPRMKENALQMSASAMLSLQQTETTAYHRDIAASIIESNEVFLFGPTDAKKELFRSLRSNPEFDAIHIEFYNSYRMTGSEEYAATENCFSGQGLELL